MRTIIASLFTTVDGVVETPEKGISPISTRRWAPSSGP